MSEPITVQDEAVQIDVRTGETKRILFLSDGRLAVVVPQSELVNYTPRDREEFGDIEGFL